MKGSPNKSLLEKASLNATGSKQEQAARRQVFAIRAFNLDFDNAEADELGRLADMFGIVAGPSLQALLRAVKQHCTEWSMTKGKLKADAGMED